MAIGSGDNKVYITGVACSLILGIITNTLVNIKKTNK